MKSYRLSRFELMKLGLWLQWRTLPTKLWECIGIMLTPSIFCTGFLYLLVLQSRKGSPSQIDKYRPIDLQDAWISLLAELDHRRKFMDKIYIGNNYNVFMPRLVVGYAPDNYPGFVKIMKLAATYLKPAEIVSFADCETLRTNIVTQHYISGVCFDDSTMHLLRNPSYRVNKDFPTYLGIRLIYPRELRIFNDTYIGNVWYTNELFPDFNDQRFSDSNDGGYMGYLREGLLTLQNAISMSYIRLNTKIDKIPKIVVQRFPEQDEPEFMEASEFMIPIFTMIGYLCPFTILMKMLYDENGNVLRTETLRLIGFTSWVTFLAWFALGITLLILASIIRLLFCRIYWDEKLILWKKQELSVLLLFLGTYSISMLSFCFMLYTVFPETKSGIVISVFIIFISVLPYMIIVDSPPPSMILSVLIHMLPNAIMGIGYHFILKYEDTYNGLTWKSMIDGDSINSVYPLGMYIVIFLALSIFYLCLGISIQYLKTRICVRILFDAYSEGIEHVTTTNYYTAFRYMTNVHEIRSHLTSEYTVRLQDVTKKCNSKIIVDNVTLDLFKDEITILMGHNGAGKTTLLYMIANIIAPTSGLILFGRYRLENFMNKSPKNVFVCINHKILFKNLTAQDQLKFFCRMKGSNFSDTEKEVSKYLNAMKLYDQRAVLTRNLSFGLKKSLAICCALIGGSKIIILDEPSSGMDLYQRSLFWKILNNEKTGRTILLTSHSVDEAERLGDRVLIMANGQVKCDGSPSFLKNIYGSPCRLVCTKKTNCYSADVTKLMRKFIPHIVPELELGSDLSYIIPNKYTGHIQDIIKELESKYANLGLETCEFRESSIEDTFLRMGSADPGECDRNRNKQIVKGESIYSDEYKNLQFVKAYKKPTALPLWLMQIRAMLWKNWIYNWHNKMLLAAQFLFPIFIIFQVFSQENNVKIGTAIDVTLRNYNKTVTVFEHDEYPNNFSKHFLESFNDIPLAYDGRHKVQSTNGISFEKYILKRVKNEKYTVKNHYLVGATVTNDTITAWFNNYPLHTAPLSLFVIHQCAINAHVNKHAQLEVDLEPLPTSFHLETRLLKIPSDFKNSLNYRNGLAFCFIWPLSVLFLVEEQRSKHKLLETISGLRLSAFWCGAFLSDFLRILSNALVMLITGSICIMFTNLTDSHLRLHLDLIVILLFIACCALPLNYLFALFFTDEIYAYIVISNFHTFFVCLFIMPDVVDCYEFVCMQGSQRGFITPHYASVSIISKIIRLSDIKRLCSIREIHQVSEDLENCHLAPWCCAISTNNLSMHRALSTECALVLLFAVIYWILIGFIETRYCRHSEMLFRNIPRDDKTSAFTEHTQAHSGITQYSDGISIERAKVLSVLRKNFNDKALLCDRVSKRYDLKTIVDRTHLIVERGEIFGIIGANGCGKSTFLKLLVGAERLTFGRIYIHGEVINKDLYSIYERIGYLSQFDHLPMFRVNQLMQFFGMLSGMSNQMSMEVCTNLAKVFGFYSYYNVEYKICSCGIRRRISFAIALLGNPSVIFLDEPFYKLDPAAKRMICNIICKLKNVGKTIILATLAARECELLCDRVTVMSHGYHIYIGNPFAISGEFINGYIVHLIAMKSRLSTATILQNIEDYILKKFSNAVIYLRLGRLIKVFIPEDDLKLSEVFAIIQARKSALNIENFSVSRTPLLNFIIKVAHKGRDAISYLS